MIGWDQVGSSLRFEALGWEISDWRLSVEADGRRWEAAEARAVVERDDPLKVRLEFPAGSADWSVRFVPLRETTTLDQRDHR